MKTQPFSCTETELSGLKVLQPFIAVDHRGFLSKTFEKNMFLQCGISLDICEELQSMSRKGTVRGLHFQRNHSQDKLVRVLTGSVFDVAVDLRKHSPTFGAWKGFYLDAVQQTMVYIPKGFAHGFLAMEDSLFSYHCGNRFDAESADGIRWDDTELAVQWPLETIEHTILSDKDLELQTFRTFQQVIGGL